MPWKHNREEAWQRLPWKQERQEIRESEGCTSWKQESATGLESAFVKLVEEERKPWSKMRRGLTDLESLLDPKGDPMSLVRWTTKSPSTVGQGIGSSGAPNQEISLGRIAGAFWASAYVPIKRTSKGPLILIEMLNAHHIKGQCQAFEQQGNPIISVDCKKKELIGNAQEQWLNMASQGSANGSQCL